MISTVIALRLVHLLNGVPPMLVTLAGIVIPVRLVQDPNGELPRLVTLAGIVILVRPVQSPNAESPMLMTPLLIFIGIAPGLLVFYIQRNVKDSAVYLEAKAAPAGGEPSKFLDIFRGGLAPRTLVAWMICLGVLGGNYTGHYGKDAATITVVPGAEADPILKGVTVSELIGHGGLYKNTPLQPGTTPLLMGTLAGTATCGNSVCPLS